MTALLKRIRCTVPPARAEAFSEAQLAWKALSGVPGFVGQCGGWSTTTRDSAVLVAVWRQRRDYDRFMAEWHDAIYLPSGQASTYDAIDVALFDVVSEFGSDTRFLPGRFIVIGQQSRLPGAHAGFEKGFVARAPQAPDRLLVVASTLRDWHDLALEGSADELVELENAWYSGPE